jgi:hypothetical protein
VASFSSNGSAEPERLTVVRRRVVIALVATMAVLLVFHYVVMTLWFGFGRRHLVGITPLMNVDEEESFSTFVQMMTLLGSSAVLFLIALRARRLGWPHAHGWLGLAAVFLYLTVDESTQVHEQLIVPLRGALDAGGVLYFTWLVVAIPLVILFVVLYLPFLRDLDGWTRNRFLLGGALYLTGTIVMEMIGGAWAEDHPGDDAVYLMVLVPVEEVFEFAGQVLFLATVLAYAVRSRLAAEIGFVARHEDVPADVD